MADTKITALTADATPTTDDLLITVNDPGGTPVNRKVTIGQVEAVLDVLNMVNAPAEANADVTDATNVAAAGAIMDGDFSTNGIMVRTAAATYSIITDGSANWDTAFGWGDHASAGYLLNVVEDTTPQLGGMLDVNGQSLGDGTLELLKFSETASAVNEITVTNAATGNGPALSATGDDLNIDLNLTPKGTGVVNAGGNRVLTTADEGSGNGIDADTLDGAEGAAYALLSTLALTTNGNGASLIGIEDSGTLITATTVEGALAENRTAIDAIEAAGYITDVVSDTTPQLGGMLDVNGNAIGDGTLELLAFTETALAVNHLNVTNAVTTAGPTLGAVGDDPNIDLNLVGKGTGVVNASGNRVLTTADEGTGNGLDADTVDGIEGSALVPTSRQVIAGDGLSDGGALTGDVTLNVDIFGQTSEATPAGTDIVLIEAAAGGSFRKTTVSALTGGGITSVADDTTPQLGGSLDVNGQSIVSVSAGNITITPDTTGSIILDGLSWPQADGDPNYVLKTDGAGQLSWTANTGSGLANVVDDITPQLGAQLDVNTFGLGDGTNLILDFVEDASAVNYLQAENEATGSGPILRATGSDANVDLNLATKGSGVVNAGGNRVLTTADEGTGNGLDADTVDGVEAAALATYSDLASTSNALGASLIGIEDSGTLITATTVEGALAENRQAIDTLEANNTGTNTGDQTITLTGDVTGSGTGSFATTIQPGAVDVAMLANGTDGELITWSATGAPTTVAVGTSGHVLTSNGVGAAPTFQAAPGASGLDASDFTTDGTILVGTGAGTYQEEGTSTLRTTIGVGTGDSPAFAGLSVTGDVQTGQGSVGGPAIRYSGDTNTGIYFPTLDVLGLSAGGVSAVTFTESTGVLQTHQANVGLTADAGSAQGGTPLTSSYNEIATVTTTGDSVTLPTAAVGAKVTIVNNGANAADVFPASGDNLGAGLNTAASLAAGETITYIARDATNWDTISTTAGGSGDALTSGTLAQFAATTSSQLAGVISDETGSGSLVFATSPTLVTPVLGTPTSGTLTNCTGLPISTGVSGLGTSVGTALGVAVGSAGAVVTNGGALGTPSSGTLTNATGLPITTGVSGLGTNVATFLGTPSSANLAAALTDETGSGSAVFATSPTLVTPVLGTPTSGTLTNCTGLPVSGITASTSTAIGVGSVELGHASDTTLARASAGNVSVEGTLLKKVGTETIWVPASAMTARTGASPATSGSVKTTTNHIMVETFDFADGADSYVQFSVAFPKSWNAGTVTAQFFWSNASGTGTVAWGIQGMALADSDVLDTAFGTAVVTTDTVTTAGDLMVSAASTAVTIAGTPGNDELVYFQVYRDDSADTLTADARLHGVKLFYTTDAANDD